MFHGMRKLRKEKDDSEGSRIGNRPSAVSDSQSNGPWVSPEVVKCIEKLNYSVTALDVSLETGLPLREVQQQLNAAAILSGGRIEPRFPSPTISKTGKEREEDASTPHTSPVLVYVFDSTLQSRLHRAGWRQKLSLYLKKIRKGLLFGLRLSFGIALIASIVLAAIFALLIWIYLSNLSRGNGRERGRGGGGGSPFSPFPPSGRPPGDFGGGGPFLGGPRFDLGDLWLFLWWQSSIDRAERRAHHHSQYYYYYPQPQPQGQHYRGGGGYYPPQPLPIGNAPHNPSSPPPPPPSVPLPVPPPPGGPPNGDGGEGEARGEGRGRREDMSFLEVVFSFLFGEKNTNRSKKKLYRTLASLIAANGGCLIAEQVAPYLDEILLLEGNDQEEALDKEEEGRARTNRRSSSSSSSSSSQHEGYMLPIVHHFSGTIASTDDGQLVYLFPLQQLATTSSSHTSSSSSSSSSSPPSSSMASPHPSFSSRSEETNFSVSLSLPLPPNPPLLEEPLIFSKATGQQLMWAFGLGIVNLLEVIFLGVLLFVGDGSLFRVLLEGGGEGEGETVLGNGNIRAGPVGRERGRGIEEEGAMVKAIVESLVPFLRPLWWGMLVYAVSYLLVPLGRWIWLHFLENQQILGRNQRRMERCTILMSHLEQSEEVQRKLYLARRLAVNHFHSLATSSSSSSSSPSSSSSSSSLSVMPLPT